MLAGEPFNRGFEEIAGLTDDQISEILFHPRDDRGVLDFSEGWQTGEDGKVRMSFRQAMYTVWRKWHPGITDEQLAEKFRQEFEQKRRR